MITVFRNVPEEKRRRSWWPAVTRRSARSPVNHRNTADMNRKLSVLLVNVLMLAGFSSASGTAADPGQSGGRLTACPESPNCVNSQATDARHAIAPIRFTGSQQEAREQVLHLLESLRRVEVVRVEQDYIRATFRSALFRFVDDVEFFFPAEEAGTTVIHVRSASRVGYFDLGVNRKRVERLRRSLQAGVTRP